MGPWGLFPCFNSFPSEEIHACQEEGKGAIRGFRGRVTPVLRQLLPLQGSQAHPWGEVAAHVAG